MSHRVGSHFASLIRRHKYFPAGFILLPRGLRHQLTADVIGSRNGPFLAGERGAVTLLDVCGLRKKKDFVERRNVDGIEAAHVNAHADR